MQVLVLPCGNISSYNHGDKYFSIFILYQISTSVLQTTPVPVMKMLTVPTVTVLIIVLVNKDSLAMERLAMVSD